MRAVAKFQFTTPAKGLEVAQSIEAVLQKWTGRKFDIAADGAVIIRRSGQSAALEKTSEAVEDRRLDRVIVLEPIERGNLQTTVDVLAGADRTAFRCVLSVGSEGGILPANVPLRAPLFIRDIVALPVPWTIGATGERAFAQSFTVSGDDVPDLEELVFSTERRLPVVVVSELNGETLAGDLHERLSQDLCGLAHTVRLSDDAAWAMTGSRGKEWSCYNGAVRIFWPYRPSIDDHRVHPLWTYDNMLSRSENEVQARDRFRGLIAGRILEASTYVADDGIFSDFEVVKIRQAADRARALAEGDGDIRALADSYAAENDQLRARVDEQNRDIEILRGNIEALTITLRSSQAAVPEAVSEAPPQTLEEAIMFARRELSGRVVIARETDSDIADLNPSAGPPDKVLRYLRTLGMLADALRSNDLGKSIPIWLREHGVECSGESETGKNSRQAKQFRTRMVDGESVECDFHAKPAEGVSPDRCVRIYFAASNSMPAVKVGYIGRHSD